SGELPQAVGSVDWRRRCVPSLGRRGVRRCPPYLGTLATDIRVLRSLGQPPAAPSLAPPAIERPRSGGHRRLPVTTRIRYTSPPPIAQPYAGFSGCER